MTQSESTREERGRDPKLVHRSLTTIGEHCNTEECKCSENSHELEIIELHHGRKRVRGFRVSVQGCVRNTRLLPEISDTSRRTNNFCFHTWIGFRSLT